MFWYCCQPSILNIFSKNTTYFFFVLIGFCNNNLGKIFCVYYCSWTSTKSYSNPKENMLQLLWRPIRLLRLKDLLLKDNNPCVLILLLRDHSWQLAWLVCICIVIHSPHFWPRIFDVAHWLLRKGKGNCKRNTIVLIISVPIPSDYHKKFKFVYLHRINRKRVQTHFFFFVFYPWYS